MIIYNGIKYAETEEELINSLFNDGEGTLAPLFKIRAYKNKVMFFITNDKGFGYTCGGLPFKFIRRDKGFFYQNTLDDDKESGRYIARKYFNIKI